MKRILKSVLLVWFTIFSFHCLALGKSADQIILPKHSHPDYEKSIEELKDLEKKADRSYQMAQEAYAYSKDLIEKKKALDDRFFSWLSFFGAVIFSGVVAATIASTRSLKLFYQSKYEENFKLLSEKNYETIKKMITDEEWRNKARIDKKVLVLNKKDTGMKADFKKVIPAFVNYKLANVTNLVDSLNLDYSVFDLVIIENCDDQGYWKLVPENKKDSEDPAIQKKYAEELQEIKEVNRIFIALGDKICPKTALIYYGKQGRGNFPSEKVDEDKRHMISYANTPSTLYGNMIDLLKFKDIIEGQRNI